MGMPPPTIFPRVVMSGRMPKYSWAPPYPRRNPVITSSKISREPYSSVIWRRNSKNPFSGSTTPMLAATGSTMMAATWSPYFSISARTDSLSL